MSDEIEIVGGLPGVEAAQGYEKMVDATAPITPDPADLSVEEAAAEVTEQRSSFERPILEREYRDVTTDDPSPDNQTITAEQAARNLADIRQAELDAFSAADNKHVQDLVDEARQAGSFEALAETPPIEQQPVEQQPIEQPIEQQPDLIDPEVAQALRNPKLLNLIQTYEQQLSAQVEQHKTAYFEGLRSNAALAAASVYTQPEFVGLDPHQIPTALQILARQNPERAKEITAQVNAAQRVVEQANQATLQQRQQAQAEFQTKWNDFATQQDQLFERAAPEMVDPDTARRVGADAVAYLTQVGLSQADIAKLWRGEASISLRDYRAQLIIKDAMAYRRAKMGAPAKVVHQVPQVQRPGSSAERQTRTEYALSEATAKLKPSMSPKEAAEYLIARRKAG